MKTKPMNSAQSAHLVKTMLNEIGRLQELNERLERRLSESRTREILLLEQIIEKDDTVLQLLAELHGCQDDQK
jgi:hypothetical protein